jgi:hypothetical protein
MATIPANPPATATGRSQRGMPDPVPPLSRRRTAALVAAGVIVAGVASSAVALLATALGVAEGFAPLRPAVYLPFVVVGVIGGVVGWRIIRSRAKRPAAVLRLLVPAVLIASFIPDAVLIVTRFLPGTTTLGGLSLSTMHLIVAAVTVLVAQRVAPVSGR